MTLSMFKSNGARNLITKEIEDEIEEGRVNKFAEHESTSVRRPNRFVIPPEHLVVFSDLIVRHF